MFKQTQLSRLSDSDQLVLYPIYDSQNIDPVFEGELQINDKIDKELNKITIIHTLRRLRVPTIAFLGLGKESSINADKFALAIRKAVKSIDEHDFVIALDHLVTDEWSIEKLVELAVHACSEANYSYRNKKNLDVQIFSEDNLDSVLDKSNVITEAINNTRDLVNKPSNQLNPLDLENYAKNLADELKVEFTSYDHDKLKEMGAGGLLAVNQGSAHPARLIVLEYNGAKNEPFTALVGKGITFDTGGYNLKTAAGMVSMKCDMGGAASVLGAFEAIVRLNKKVNLYAIIATTENMISGSSYKADDVITMMNKKTVEVTNTDAEGRIVLADALTHAVNLKAKRIVDVATLTGACVVALGNEFTGVFSNSDSFYDEVKEAAYKANESIWRLPLSEKISKSLTNTTVADLVNSTYKPPGASVAAAFLQEFVDETEWVHLDIAGTAFLKETEALEKGATGIMIKTLVELIK